MTTPTIHLNGTGRESLLEDISRAMSALNTAEEKLRLMRPNARDYYPQGPDAFRQASAEHEQRIEKVASVHRELAELAEAIYDAPGRR